MSFVGHAWRKPNQRAEPPRRSAHPCSGVVRAGGFAAGSAKETFSNPHAGSRDAGGKKRPRQAPNKDALISQNLALLAASNPRGWMDAENIPPPPQRRAQMHTDLEAGEILKMTTRIAMEYTEGNHDLSPTVRSRQAPVGGAEKSKT